MNYLSVESLSKSYDERILFQDISFGLEQGQKAALVGVNGSGKSTLLRILAGLEQPDSGQFTFRKDIKVSMLPQNPVFDPAHTILQAIFQSNQEELQLIQEYEYYLARVEKDPTAAEPLQAIMERMDNLQAWDFEAQIKAILGRLGLKDLDQPTSSLSGGQRKRVALARALIEKPDFLILDEPTNHLDLDTIEWLEGYLANQQMSLLLVTHDRYFLDRVTTQILEIDQESIMRYQGNYSYFLQRKEERLEQNRAEVDRARNLMRKELDWMRRQPKARGTKAKYRVDAFEGIKEKAGQRIDQKQVMLDVQTTRQGKKVLELEHLYKAFDQKAILQDFSYVFKRGDRVGIVGPNGTGKTTFLNILTGLEKADKGKILKGETTLMGYYRQEDMPFKDDQRVIDVVKEVAEVIALSNGSELSASQLLDRFLFPPKRQYAVVGNLSGGEKRRLQLLRVLMANPNFLILDEPTNDLDLLTLNILEEFLEAFSGCLVLVSHDRYFMDRLVDHLFVFEGKGQLRDFPGNYTDLREEQKAKEAQERADKEAARNAEAKKKAGQPFAAQSKTAKPAAASADGPRKISYKERRELAQIEQDMEQLEEQKAALIEKMNGGGSHEELHTWGQELQQLEQNLAAKEDRWLELSELAD